MPSTTVYEVAFAGGNLAPRVNTLNWPEMTHGGSSVMPLRADADGLTLEVSRTAAAKGEASNSLYVMPVNLPVESRLLMQLSFDSPVARGEFDDTHAWAVDLKVKKLAIAKDTSNDEAVSVTCQFRSAFPADRVRLNTPFMEQGDNDRTATDLDSSDGFGTNGQPIEYTLQHQFCGVGAVGGILPSGHAVGCGFLNVGARADARVFTHTSLWANVVVGRVAMIGALGVSVITRNGVGKMSARLTSFSVDVWPLLPLSGGGGATV